MNILLTGGSRGLGIEIARQQIELGNHVFVLNRSVSDALQQLLESCPNNTTYIQCDLSQPSELASTFQSHFPAKVPIDGLVNNAAMAYDDLVSNLSLDRLDEMFRVNVFSAMELSKLTIRRMLLHKTAGSIVHISSISVHTGYKGLAMYAASKGALEAFSKNTAREWGSTGIRSNCVVAGFMETSMSATLTEVQRQQIYRRTALKRATDVASVAHTVGYLLSDASRSITGQNMFVDSGTI